MIYLYIILAVLVFWAIFAYNSFVRLINRSKEAWADIDVQLKRRYDLIPNLINTVKGYAAHESATLENVTNLRNSAMQAKDLGEKSKAELALSGALQGLMVSVEAYPDLKANQNFLELQKELSDTENKIQAARRFYNTNVRDLNISVESFPNNFIAKAFKFSQMEFFELGADEAIAKEPVQVKF